MGMFDSLIVKCPRCNENIEFQSKAGECLLNDYNLSTVPPEIIEDLDGKLETCQECGSVVTLIKSISTKVSLHIE